VKGRIDCTLSMGGVELSRGAYHRTFMADGVLIASYRRQCYSDSPHYLQNRCL